MKHRQCVRLGWFTHIWPHSRRLWGPAGSLTGRRAAWRPCCSGRRYLRSAWTSHPELLTGPETHRKPQQTLTQRSYKVGEQQDPPSLKAFGMFRWLVSDTHHLHCVVVDELLCGDTVDLVHKALLIREEVVEFVGQLPTEGDAAFVALIQVLHHWEEMGRDINTTNYLLNPPHWCKYSDELINTFTLFDSSRRIELGRFNLSFCQMKGGSQKLGCLHVKHQLLHLPVGGSTSTSDKSWECRLMNQRAALDYS